MKKLLSLVSICTYVCIAILITSCDDDNSIAVTPKPTTDVSIISQTGEYEVSQGETLTLVGIVNSTTKNTYTWSIDGTVYPAFTDSIFNFSAETIGEHTIAFIATNEYESKSATATVSVYGKYVRGAFILNEGWYGHTPEQNGDLVHISTSGNAQHVMQYGLGTTTQHAFWYKGNVYLVSKATDSEHLRRIVVLDANTMNEVADYTTDINNDGQIVNQSNIGAAGNSIFIIATDGTYALNKQTKAITKIKNGTVSYIIRTYAANNKLFAANGTSIKVFEDGKDTISKQIDMGANVTSLALADDGNIFASLKTSPLTIAKINTSNYSTMATSTVDASVTSMGSSYTNQQLIWPKGDTIYFASTQSTYSAQPVYIYQHIFSTNTTNNLGNITPFLPYGMIYGGIAISPVTGEIYASTIGSFGSFNTENAISILKFEKGAAPAADNITVLKNYKGYTNFACGIYFPQSYVK